MYIVNGTPIAATASVNSSDCQQIVLPDRQKYRNPKRMANRLSSKLRKGSTTKAKYCSTLADQAMALQDH